jgi:hypothetical protein
MEAGKLMHEGRVAEAAAVARRLIRVSKFNHAMLFLVVADMVFKPYWTDYVTLGLMALALAAAAYLLLLGGPKRIRMQAAQ